MDLRQIKTEPDDFGMMTYDPAFMNTASCQSRITYHRRRQGHSALSRLSHRGAGREMHLPRDRIPAALRRAAHRRTNEGLDTARSPTTPCSTRSIKKFIDGFRYDAHPMGDAGQHHGRALHRLSRRQGHRTIREAAAADHAPDRQDADHRGLSPIATAGHSVRLSRQRTQLPRELHEHAVAHDRAQVRPIPVLARALDILFILHADHEQNCSTNTMRVIGSSQADPYLADGGSGCGAVRAAARRRQRRSSAHARRDRLRCRKFPAYIKRVKAGEIKLMGFGHRVYKNYDPRARIIKRVADEVFEVTGRNPQARNRAGTGAYCAGGRILRQAQALSQRGLLLRHHLPGHGLPA